MSGPPFDPAIDVMLGVASPAAAGTRSSRLADALEKLPAPIYTTDGQGWAIFFNRACLDFASNAGAERRCVSWQLRAAMGEPLPGDSVRMREMIRRGRVIYGVTGVAEWPDGSRSRFRPFSTPWFDENGDAVGAINILIDIGDRGEIARLRDHAELCRRLTHGITSHQTLETLSVMADEYEEKARVLTSLN